MPGTLVVDNIKNLDDKPAINVAGLSASGRYVRQVFKLVDPTSYTATTTWTLGSYSWMLYGFAANSILKITYNIPTRNDSASWGGCYIEPQINFNSSTWQSLGSCGYDGGVMHLGYATIGHYKQTLLIDPGLAVSFTTQFRFYFKAYDGTAGLNNALNHEVNVVSGTAPLMSGTDGLQHYMHVLIEEYARYN